MLVVTLREGYRSVSLFMIAWHTFSCHEAFLFPVYPYTSDSNA